MISASGFLKKSGFSVPQTKTRIVNLSTGFCFGPKYTDRLNHPCDHFDEEVHWTIEPDGKGNYYFHNIGSKKYLNFQIDGRRKVIIMGSKLALGIEKKRDQNSFRIITLIDGKTFCFDSRNEVLGECVEDEKDLLSNYYVFDQEPYTPLVEPNVLYSLSHIAISNSFSYFPGEANEGEQKQFVRFNYSRSLLSSLFKFSPHPTEKGIYQIINGDDINLVMVENSKGDPRSIMARYDKATLNNPYSWFRLVRNPFNPDKMFIITNVKPNSVMNGLGFNPSTMVFYNHIDFHFTVTKTCENCSWIREDVWYQLLVQSGQCIIYNSVTNQLQTSWCKLTPEYFWKFKWDNKHKGYIITHKKTGKVLHYNKNTHVTSVDILKDDKAQRWDINDRSYIFHTMIQIANRYNSLCFNPDVTSPDSFCMYNSFIRPYEPVFKLKKKGVVRNGYVGTCGKESGFLPKPPVVIPNPPVSPPIQPPVVIPNPTITPPQPPVIPQRPPVVIPNPQITSPQPPVVSPPPPVTRPQPPVAIPNPPVTPQRRPVVTPQQPLSPPHPYHGPRCRKRRIQF